MTTLGHNQQYQQPSYLGGCCKIKMSRFRYRKFRPVHAFHKHQEIRAFVAFKLVRPVGPNESWSKRYGRTSWGTSSAWASCHPWCLRWTIASLSPKTAGRIYIRIRYRFWRESTQIGDYAKPHEWQPDDMAKRRANLVLQG